jgi:hypothetical protein
MRLLRADGHKRQARAETGPRCPLEWSRLSHPSAQCRALPTEIVCRGDAQLSSPESGDSWVMPRVRASVRPPSVHRQRDRGDVLFRPANGRYAVLLRPADSLPLESATRVARASPKWRSTGRSRWNQRGLRPNRILTGRRGSTCKHPGCFSPADSVPFWCPTTCGWVGASRGR